MAINPVRFFHAVENGLVALRMGLIRLLMAAAIASISWLSHAAAVQLISVKEVSPGVVSATVGLFTAESPKPADFWLRFDERGAIRARKVKPGPSALPQASVIFCIDQSSSIDPSATQQIREALKAVLLNPVLPLDTALWVFDSDVTKLRGFSKDAPPLAAAIGQIGAEPQRDAKAKLYEAIVLMLSELRNYRTEGPKRVILITAGKDDGSDIGKQVVINEAKAQNIEIDTIAFGNVSDTGPELLARLAEDTGGHFFLAANGPQLARELRTLLDSTPVQVVDVLFQYETTEELRGKGSAKLEFAPDGQTPASLPIRLGLSAPKQAPFGVSLPDHPATKQEIDHMIFQWITFGAAGYIAYLAVYILSRKRAKPTPSDRSGTGKETDWRKP